MPSEDLYELDIGFEVKIAKWRVDDQTDPDNREWALFVYDRLQNKWIDTSDLDRSGEEVYITSFKKK
jgi:hypothetical protein